MLAGRTGRVVLLVTAGAGAGAVYTVSPLTAWCVVSGAVVLTLAGRGLPASERRTLNIILVAALVARLAAIGALFILNTPMHDDESVGMLSGDEAYGLSRALRTRDVVAGAPTNQYDYFVAYDEYGRNSYMPFLTGVEVLFGPTPYSMRLLNTLFFTISAILLFRLTRTAFGALPAFGGLLVLLFFPTLFLWSISLLKEPLYLLGTALIVAGVIGTIRNRDGLERGVALAAALAGFAIVSGLRQGAIALALLGLGCGIAGLWLLSSTRRFAWTTAAVVVAVLALMSQPSAQQRVTSALEAAAKTHSGHVFTVGHAYKLLDEGFYFSPAAPSASGLTLTVEEAARYVVRAAVSFVTVPWPWQLASVRELSYLPEQVLWYLLVALLPIGFVAGWRRDPVVTTLLAGYTIPTAAALALTNGNVGTLLRLRGMIIPYVVWLSALGFVALLQRMAAKETAR
jgi:hypothetical protein